MINETWYELNVNEQSESPAKGAGLLKISAGNFIDWRSDYRALIPPTFTRMRIKHILRHAADRGGVAHFWILSENVASHPTTMRNLAVVEEVAKGRDVGFIEVETQLQHCLRSTAS